jgi:hypothetical protein
LYFSFSKKEESCQLNVLLQAAERSIQNVYDFIHAYAFLTVDTADGPGLLLEFAPTRRV